MTPVRGKRGRLVHAMMIGIRRDLDPAEIPNLVCGKRLRGAIVVSDEEISCPACLDICVNGN